jgi:hypothetical protein
MTEYQSIDPADVRPGDVVEADFELNGGYTIRGPVWSEGGDLVVGTRGVDAATAIRLISRPAPPEPPLRVGDFVRSAAGPEYQIDGKGSIFPWHVTGKGGGGYMPDSDLTRIEPPVGWPVGINESDGSVAWWYRPAGARFYMDEADNVMSWPDLLAAGGCPALAPGGAA